MPNPTNLQRAQTHWADTLGQQQLQMTKATFDFMLAGSQVVEVGENTYWIATGAAAAEWLQGRETLRAGIARTLASIAGREITLQFVVRPDTPQEVPTERAPDEPERSAADEVVAGVDWYTAFYGRGNPGYTGIPHHTSQFWQFLLGPAFALWLYLVSEDTSSLDNPAHWWTPPATHNMSALTGKLNRSHHRYIGGDEEECTKSKNRRADDEPLTDPAQCCGNPRYELLRFKPHRLAGCGLKCLHWRIGLLEILDTWKLVTIEFEDPARSYNFEIQTWRMLPVLTPYQVGLLNPVIQSRYEKWITGYGRKFNIPSWGFFKGITVENIVPLLPTHDQPVVKHNFSQRERWQTFLRHAERNPRYQASQVIEEEEI